ncbi:hypothetical protein ATI61_1337 [Archangium gephyra]|uniref:Gliding motility protein MglA n=1 Tax=Archangium gephyra TaxID=48 RepID=A0AAC8TJG2_9BACT|nr:hypothetical protein [Archangium gephyra]AKJ08267.1 gliding motility protein MglA [Archangium gephyra]REG14215.1 hypothetical protein ATI61_1337 [Archangium gephyra]
MNLNRPWIAALLFALAMPAFGSSINEAAREINLKVVYVGAESAATAANLQFIHANTRPEIRGQLSRSPGPKGEVLAFDFVPIPKGDGRGYKPRFHLATALGAPEARELRRLALKDVDAVVFIADSDPARMKANQESLRNLKSDLEAQGLDWTTVPWVYQFVNREHPKALPVEEMSRQLRTGEQPVIVAELKTGAGILDTMKAIAKLCMMEMKKGAEQKAPPAR